MNWRWTLAIALAMALFGRALGGSTGPGGAASRRPIEAAVPTPRALSPDRGWTMGEKKVLVVRADFSDAARDAVSTAAARTMVEDQVAPYFERCSYGQVKLVTTVPDKVFRLPQPSSTYFLDETKLDADLYSVLRPEYPPENYDRIVVAPSTNVLGGEGSAIVGGKTCWILQGFAFATIAHELGHSFGLGHALRWNAPSSNDPVDARGTYDEYGDSYDVMGGGKSAAAEFNPIERFDLGWLPESVARVITASGQYRVYAFDAQEALASNQPLALRIARGPREYWIGLRGHYTDDPVVAAGAYVLWTDGGGLSQLLQMSRVSNQNQDILNVGATFTDSLFGISFAPVARGVDAFGSYLDVTITLAATPRNSVVGWGNQYLPPDMLDVGALAGGGIHGVAELFDGRARPWDFSDGSLQASVFVQPSDLSHVVQVVAAGSVGAAVLNDGTARFWTVAGFNVPTPSVPAAIGSIRQLAIGAYNGEYHFVALRPDGSVACWGDNALGQATVPDGLGHVVAVSAGTGPAEGVKLCTLHS